MLSFMGSLFGGKRRLAPAPFPQAWETFLCANVAHYRRLSPTEQARLRDDVRVLATRKYWEGCGGLDVTDEMKVTIAAQASLMLLGREHNYFRRVWSILVYPTSSDRLGGEYDGEEGLVISGRAMSNGPVALAWDAVLAEGRNPSWGGNVVIHEFAHQLDFCDLLSSAMPDLPDRRLAERWRSVIGGEYDRLCLDTRQGLRTDFGEHAARSRAELFATASERFFTVPARLRNGHPELYDLLADYYRVNPLRWFSKDAP